MRSRLAPIVHLWCDVCGRREVVRAGIVPKGWWWDQDKLVCPRHAKGGADADA